MGDLKIDVSANVQSGGWQVRVPSPAVRVSEPDAQSAPPATTTINVSDAALNDLSAAAAFVVGSMRSEARITAALLKRAIAAYTSRDDADGTSRSTSSPAAAYLASDLAAASLFALQPLLALLRRPGL